jgi:hypothetical protein
MEGSKLLGYTTLGCTGKTYNKTSSGDVGDRSPGQTRKSDREERGCGEGGGVYDVCM